MVETLIAASPETDVSAWEQRRRFYLRPVLVVALVARLLLIFLQLRDSSGAKFFGMATDLGSLSRNFALGHGLSSPFGGSTGPSAFLAPGYPVLIGTIFKLFGVDTFGSAIVVMLMQTAFCLGTIALLMLLTRRLFGVRAANLAGIVWAISPPILWLPALFWETSLSLLLVCALLTLSLDCARTPQSMKLWLSLGACAGIAMLVNPSLLTILICCFAWTAWHARKSLAGPVVAALVGALLFAPWPIRNLRVMHAFIPLRTNLGYELWQGNRLDADGFFNPTLHPSVDPVEFQAYSTLGELGYMQRKSTASKTIIFADPIRFARLSVKRAASFWSGIDNKASALVVAHILLTSVLGIAGLCMLIVRRRYEVVTLMLPILLLFPAPYYITHPDGRFRLVIDPILTALAAYAITCWRERSKQTN